MKLDGPQRPILYNSRGQESLNKASGITCTRVEKFVVGNIIFFAGPEEQRATGEMPPISMTFTLYFLLNNSSEYSLGNYYLMLINRIQKSLIVFDSV